MNNWRAIQKKAPKLSLKYVMRALKYGSILPYQIELFSVGRLKWKCKPLFSPMPLTNEGPGETESFLTLAEIRACRNGCPLHPWTDRRPLPAFSTLESLTTAASAQWLFCTELRKTDIQYTRWVSFFPSHLDTDTGSYGPGVDPGLYAECSSAEQRVRRSTCVYKANLWRFPCRPVCFTHAHLFSPSDRSFTCIISSGPHNNPTEAGSMIIPFHR